MHIPKNLQNAIFEILLFPFLALFCVGSSYSSISVNGNFTALNQCPAYISKIKKTNPDAAQTVPFQQYKLVEINKNNPDWYRIVMPSQQNALRWVAAHCGEAEYSSKDKGQCQLIPG